MEENDIAAWFNCKYFPIYYSHRNILEAETLVDKILITLNAKKNQTAVDFCCGRGRYSIALNKRGLRVVGVDFSSNQIKYAKAFENENLKFVLSDIASFTNFECFDYAFNFFSSFGYTNDETNIKILKTINKCLKPLGKFVLDYWNPSNLKYIEMFEGSSRSKIKYKQGFDFQVNATINDGFYKKEIIVKDGELISTFKEQIMVLKLKDFQEYFSECGFKINCVFGDYKLERYQELSSERMIFIVEKVYIC
jgi:SAM-dependent methyltransferase